MLRPGQHIVSKKIDEQYRELSDEELLADAWREYETHQAALAEQRKKRT